jgi:hypothetical protein
MGDVKALQGAIEALSAKLDTVTKSDNVTPDTNGVAEMTATLTALSERVDGLATKNAVSALEKQLADKTAEVESLSAAHSTKIGELEAAHATEIGELNKQVDELAALIPSPEDVEKMVTGVLQESLTGESAA